MPVPQTWAEGHSAADLCERWHHLLADPLPPFLQEGLVKRLGLSAEGLTLLGHPQLCTLRESDLNSSLFFLLLLSLPLPVIVLLFPTPLSPPTSFSIPLSLTNFLPYFSGHQVETSCRLYPVMLLTCHPPGQRPLCLCFWGSLSQPIRS